MPNIGWDGKIARVLHYFMVRVSFREEWMYEREWDAHRADAYREMQSPEWDFELAGPAVNHIPPKEYYQYGD